MFYPLLKRKSKAIRGRHRVLEGVWEYAAPGPARLNYLQKGVEKEHKIGKGNNTPARLHAYTRQAFARNGPRVEKRLVREKRIHQERGPVILYTSRHCEPGI